MQYIFILRSYGALWRTFTLSGVVTGKGNRNNSKFMKLQMQHKQILIVCNIKKSTCEIFYPNWFLGGMAYIDHMIASTTDAHPSRAPDVTSTIVEGVSFNLVCILCPVFRTLDLCLLIPYFISQPLYVSPFILKEKTVFHLFVCGGILPLTTHAYAIFM